MATRIERSRPNKRPQATATYTTATGAITLRTGKHIRLDPRGFPTTGGLDVTRTTVTVV